MDRDIQIERERERETLGCGFWARNTKRKRYFFLGEIIQFCSLDWLHFWCRCQGHKTSMQMQHSHCQSTPLPIPSVAHLVFGTCGQHLVQFPRPESLNGLSQSAVNASPSIASVIYFCLSAKCHRLCSDSINQSLRIINNQNLLGAAVRLPDCASALREIMHWLQNSIKVSIEISLIFWF